MGASLTPYYEDDAVVVYHGDYRDVCPLLSHIPFNLVVFDPPFDIWDQVDVQDQRAWVKDIPTKLAFTNPQNRRSVEDIFGRPRYELVWDFSVGRWVSHTGPRFTHELILEYGPTGDAYVGPINNAQPQCKGHGAIGKDALPVRMYYPRERKQLESVLHYPRNVSNSMGVWGKPLGLVATLLEWADCDMILDPFMGSGTVLRAAKDQGRKAVGIELDERHCELAVARLGQGVLAF